MVYVFFLKRKILPELIYAANLFQKKCIAALLSSGVWNSVNYSGYLLMNCVDVLLANLFLGSVEMGILAAAKTLPVIVFTLVGNLYTIWAPKMTQYYAEKAYEQLKHYIIFANKIFAFFTALALAFIVGFGKDFFSLWLPGQNAEKMQILAFLSCASLVFCSGIQACSIVFTVVNKLKINSLLVLLTGVANILIVILFLRLTNWGCYAIVSITSILVVVRNLLYNVPFSARYLGFSWWSFAQCVWISVASFAIATAVFILIRHYCDCSSWLRFILSVATAFTLSSILLGMYLLGIRGIRELFHNSLHLSEKIV